MSVHSFQQGRKPMTLPPIQPDAQSQLGRLTLDVSFQQPDAQPVPHATSYARAFGDIYAICLVCDAISLPLFTLEDAKRWECPRSVAEIDCALNQAIWER